MTNDEALIYHYLKSVGDDPEREGLKETPFRVIKSWSELYKGYHQDPLKILEKDFSSDGYDQMIILRDVEMYSTCEHHMLPFWGKAHIGYIPNKRVVGISKLARLLECYSRRLQIQERLTKQIADALVKYIKPKGVMVVIEAQHFCITSRGIQKKDAKMVTSAVTGCFKKDEKSRAEFLRLINK